MFKIVNIVGARPQFIKYFPVSRALDAYNSGAGNIINDILVHTGQHYDYAMSRVFFDELCIKEPEYHLGVGSGSHGEQTGMVLREVEQVLLKEKPDTVIVYGDTNSTLGGALAAAKLHIPVVHIEAGLRSFNKQMPEEINRVLTDHISARLLCPSMTAVQNLIREGFRNVLNDGRLIPANYFPQGESLLMSGTSDSAVINVGDVMYDALLFSVAIAEKKSNILERLDISPKDYYLLTLHRAENTDNLNRLEEIICFVNDLTEGSKVIFPMHPRIKKAYHNSPVKFSNNIVLTEPLGYFDLLMTLKNSRMALTDSGGMQKEALWMQIPCVTLRDETEWTETVESGWNTLYRRFSGMHNPGNAAQCYGDGKAAERIISAITALLSRTG